MKLRSRIVWSVLVVAMVVCPFALGHLWFYGNTVHFKGTEVDFGAPPSRYAVYDSSHEWGYGKPWRPGTEFFQDYDREPKEPVDPTHLYRRTARLESSGQYRQALKAWRWGWTHGVGDLWIDRERITLLEILVRKPHLKGAGALLRATAVDKPIGTIPETTQLAEELKPFGRYHQTDNAKITDRERAARFLAIANDFPRSPMAEPALINVPRLLLGCDAKRVDASDVQTSRIAIADLVRRYPYSRFRNEGIGWLGRIEYLAGRYGQAVEIYRRQLGSVQTHRARARVLDSIVRCELDAGNMPAAVQTGLELYVTETDLGRKNSNKALVSETLGHIDGAQARQFWKRLRADQGSLSNYLDYRLEMTEPTPDLLTLATRNRLSGSSSRYQGHILARLAQAAYLLKHRTAARRFAIQSLAVSQLNPDRALATYLLASIASREGRFVRARDGYEAILGKYPKDYLCAAARENLAIIDEREHRLGDALDLYHKLGYDFDEAYLLDIRMSTSQIANYIESHPRSKERDLLHFSLGMRYLREDKFGLAVDEFHRVPSKILRKFRTITYPSEKNDPGIDADLIQDPIKTAQDLGRLYRRYRIARTVENKAQALTKVADYYYDHRTLLLYNPALWHQERSTGIGAFWNPSIASKKDNQALERYHWLHECYARTVTLCEEILRKYPKASVRYRVAYRAACAAERLGHMNRYWRWQDMRYDFVGKAVNLMRIAQNSPDKDLASKARKYVGVFAESREMAREAFKDADKDQREERSEHRHSADWAYY